MGVAITTITADASLDTSGAPDTPVAAAPIATTDVALLRLLQLSSAALPIGGFAFSQGLEYAVEAGWVRDGDGVYDWLSLQAAETLAQVDLPLLLRLHDGFERGDTAAIRRWNSLALACRETAELRLADTAMGEALLRLLRGQAADLSDVPAGEVSYLTAFAAAAWHWRIEPAVALLGWLWSWLENQVTAATKLVPLGQSQAQTLLGRLQTVLPPAVTAASNVGDDEIGSGLPGLALASALHESQYTRLFRS